MAIYRNIQMSFWTDPKVIDDFSPEDKYFYLYIMTNPHTNLCGCYELSTKQASIEVGYTPEMVERCLSRLEDIHGVIKYSKDTKEVLIINWGKYNWTKSKDLKKYLSSEIANVKNEEYKEYLCFELECGTTAPYNFEEGGKTLFESEGEGGKTLSEEEQDPVGTTDSLVSDSLVSGKRRKTKPKDKVKHIYGEYHHVRLTDAEYERLVNDYGEEAVLAGIKNVDEYCQEHGKTYSDYNLVLRNWGIKTPKLEQIKKTIIPPKQEEEVIDPEWQKNFE